MTQRRARDLAGKPLGKWACTHCKDGVCNKCVDIKRVIVNLEPICRCTRSEHEGDPRARQILDPTTGVVHGPGLSVTEDGEVHRG